jgi:hypothetical protein
MEVVMGLALGAGALLLVKKGRPIVKGAVGWTARKTGWVASRVRASIDRTRQVARAEFERGRAEALAEAERANSNGTGNGAARAPVASTTSPTSDAVT